LPCNTIQIHGDFLICGAIVFDALGSLDSARESCMAPLPAVLALGYSWVHISISNSSNIPADIETSVY